MSADMTITGIGIFSSIVIAVGVLVRDFLVRRKREEHEREQREIKQSVERLVGQEKS